MHKDQGRAFYARRRYQAVCCGLLVVAVASAHLWRNVGTGEGFASYHNDEAGWISSSYYYANLVLKQDTTWDRWAYPEPGLKGYAWGYLQTHLGQFMLGIPLKLHALRYRNGETFSGYYEYRFTREDNEILGTFPPDDVLLTARRISSMSGVLCCLSIFLFVAAATNLRTALLAAGLLLANELFVRNATRAMMDAPFNSFFFLSGTATVLLLRTKRVGNAYRYAMLAGICIGLACSVKVTGLVLGTGTVGVVLLLRKFAGRFTWREAGISLIAFILCAIGVIYSLNPMFWPSPSEFSTSALKKEVRLITGHPPVMAGPPAPTRTDYPQIANLAKVLEFPLLYPRWKYFLEMSKAPREWGESRITTFHRRLFLDFSSIRYEWILIFIGLLAAIWKYGAALRSGAVDAAIVPAVYFVCSYAFILALMMYNWERYYITTVSAYHILAAMGAFTLIDWIIRFVQRRFKRAPVDGAQLD